MELKINDNHKKLIINLNKKEAKKIFNVVGSITLSAFLFSGCGKTTAKLQGNKNYGDESNMTSYSQDVDNSNSYNDILEHYDDEKIYIDDITSVKFDDDRNIPIDNYYTYGDLKHITDIIITIHEETDYSFLNYMPKLKNLFIIDRSSIQSLKNIDGSKFNSGISISIINLDDKIFDEYKYQFLKDISKIDTLTLGDGWNNFYIDSAYLQSLKNVDNLELGLDHNSNFAYEDLTYLKSLKLFGLPYDIAIQFSKNALDSLEKAGVKVLAEHSDKDITDEFVKIVEDIHKIYLSLNISENDTDQEKLNKILIYVLENLSYDEEVSNAIENGEEHSALAERFYTKGAMTAVFEKETQICGNYATLTYALCREAGLGVYNLESSNHLWNAVKIGDYYYFVDSTWLDTPIVISKKTTDGQTINISFEEIHAEDVLKSNDSNEISKLNWYMEDPTNLPSDNDKKESHQYTVLPPGLNLTSIQNSDDISDISNNKFKLTINNKVYIITGAALAGILSGLGIGILIHKNKLSNKRKKQDDFSFYDYSYDSEPYSTYRHR